MCVSTIEKHGATPANIQWTVVRGDNANLLIEFFEDDEETPFTTSGWTYKATAYDSIGNVIDNLATTSTAGAVEIKVPASITADWGTGYRSVVAELPFDLQVFIEGGSAPANDTTWTPVIGTICVIGDVSPASL